MSCTTWTFCAFNRKCGMFGRQVWVNAMMQPSGRVMHKGLVVDYLLIICASGRKKYQVVPKSKMSWFIGVWISIFNTQLHVSLVLGVYHSFVFVIICIISCIEFVDFGSATIFSVGVGIGWPVHNLVNVYIFLPIHPNKLSRQDCFMRPKQTSIR